MDSIKTAIVHDWLTGMRGGEKCLEVFCELFPDATVFTLLHNKGSVSPAIENMDIRTSFLQGLPGVAKNYRNYLPLFPAAVESFDLSDYDLVISSSHCAAKGARRRPGALHICYCYTPVRYAWMFFDEYFGRENAVKRWFISRMIDSIRKWDLKTNKRIDYFIAISDNIKNRIANLYSRPADVIYPPVDLEGSILSNDNELGYLMVSALVPYKRVDLAIRAFNANGKRLTVVGTGNELDYLKSIARDNIDFLGWVDDKDLKALYSRCSALIFPGEEDFGIVPVEAQSYGKPIIAYAAGGALETVVPFFEAGAHKPTGVLFEEQSVEAIERAIKVLEANRDSFDPKAIRANAERFDRGRFKKEFEEYIKDRWKEHSNSEESAREKR